MKITPEVASWWAGIASGAVVIIGALSAYRRRWLGKLQVAAAGRVRAEQAASALATLTQDRQAHVAETGAIFSRLDHQDKALERIIMGVGGLKDGQERSEEWQKGHSAEDKASFKSADDRITRLEVAVQITNDTLIPLTELPAAVRALETRMERVDAWCEARPGSRREDG